MFAVAVLSVARLDAQEPQNNKLPVLVHFANWHQRNVQQNTWGDANTIPLRPEDHMGYDSFDVSILKEQNQEMLRYNMVPLVSWWGPGSRAGDEFLDHYLTIPGPKIGILYEAAGGIGGRLPENRDGWIDFNDSRVVERFERDVRHLHARYWSRPKYADRWFRIDDKPVFFIWVSHAFRGPFDQIAKRLKREIPVYIIGSNFNIGPHPFPRGIQSVVRGMDALSAYGIYNPRLARETGGQLSDAYVERYKQRWREWMVWLKREAPGVKFIPPFEFTFMNNRGSPVLNSTRDQGEHLAQTMQFLVAESICNKDPVLNMYLGVSYNEHFEGSAFEPTVQYGKRWLNIIDKYLSTPSTLGISCRGPIIYWP
jgi:hypothetical protein